MAIVYNKLAPTDGLVLCLDSANRRSYPGTGTSWRDLSGNGNGGTLINGVTYSGQGISFDGSNDYIDVPNAAPLNVTTTATVSCWVYPRANLYQYVQSKRSGSADPPYAIARFNSNNAFFLTSNSPFNYKSVFSSSNSVPNDSWTHILGTFNGSADIQIYINGILDIASTESGGSPFSAMQTTASPVLLGRYETTSANYSFNGIIDDFRLYSRALTNQEILTLYNVSRRRFL